MSYIFRGRICGYICHECIEPLANVKVRLYSTRKDQNVPALAVASPKDTFAVLSEADVRRKESSLLGEFETNADGEFVAELGDAYKGGAFEVDVYCGTVPGLKPPPNPPDPVQFTVTVVQPLWRGREGGSIAIWEHCLHWRHWCWVRAKFGAWVICGHVRVCKTGEPVPNVKVSAFDVDWLQDDPLGSPAITDANGKFRIDYPAADFKKDIFGFNIELFGGPDLYFKVESLSGDPLLTEPSARGRQPDRENAGPCFCVELCVEKPPIVTHAWFTRVGDFGIYSDINHLTDGHTSRAVPVGFPGAHGGPGFGFFGNMKLVGDCPVSYPGGGPAMRYRFLYEVLGSGAGLQPLLAGNIVATKVGDRPITWNVGGTPAPQTYPQDIYVAPFGATPPGPTPPPALPPNVDWGPIPPVVIVPDGLGWVTVDPAATNGGFAGPLVRFASGTVVPGGIAPGSGPGVAPASPKIGTMLRIVFEAEPVSGPTATTPTLTNELEHIYVNNWSDVNELTIAQFVGPGNNSCSGLSTSLDIEYTADHELMAEWSLHISTAASIPGGTPVLPSGTTPRGSVGGVPPGLAPPLHQNISTWPACSYVLSLTTRRMLTDGENDDSGHTNPLTFCKD